MEILELKISGIKNSVNKLNSKIEKEKIIFKLKDRTIKLSNLNNREKIDCTKINRASGIYGTISKDLTFVSLSTKRKG